MLFDMTDTTDSRRAVRPPRGTADIGDLLFGLYAAKSAARLYVRQTLFCRSGAGRAMGDNRRVGYGAMRGPCR